MSLTGNSATASTRNLALQDDCLARHHPFDASIFRFNVAARTFFFASLRTTGPLWTSHFAGMPFSSYIADSFLHREIVLSWLKRRNSLVFPSLTKPICAGQPNLLNLYTRSKAKAPELSKDFGLNFFFGNAVGVCVGSSTRDERRRAPC